MRAITHEIRITHHAIERYRERIDPSASWLAAHLAIRRMLITGRHRPTPRHWMRRPFGPGTVYVYPVATPGVCVVVAADVAVTVLTRELNRSRPLGLAGRASPRPRATPPALPVYPDDLAA